MKFYFTFGQQHAHRFAGITFDKDCVVQIEAGSREQARAKMFSAFGDKWSMQYNEAPDMEYFPRGIFKI